MGKWCVFLCAKKKKRKTNPVLFIVNVSVWSNFIQISETRCHWWPENVSVLAPEVFADLSSLIPSFGVIVMGVFMLLFCVWLESSLLKAILSWLSPILFIYIIFFVAIMCCYKFIWMRVTQALDFPLIHSVVEGFFSLWLNILKLLVAELLGTRSKHIKGWGKKCYLFWEDMKCKFLG